MLAFYPNAMAIPERTMLGNVVSYHPAGGACVLYDGTPNASSNKSLASQVAASLKVAGYQGITHDLQRYLTIITKDDEAYVPIDR